MSDKKSFRLNWQYLDRAKLVNVDLDDASLAALDFFKVNQVSATVKGLRVSLWRIGKPLKSGEFRAHIYLDAPTAKSHKVITLADVKGTLPSMIANAESILFSKFLPEP